VKKDTQEDSIVVRDRGSRRQFIRTGGAMLLAGASAKASGNTLVADCDRNPGSEEKNPDQPGSDNDTGTNADPSGCGRKNGTPKISRADPADSAAPRASTPVVKIKV